MALTWSMYYLYYLNKTCPPSHCHSSLMATGALGHTHVRLHVLSIQDQNKAQDHTRAKRIIIIHASIYKYIYMQVYILFYFYCVTHTHTGFSFIYIYIYIYIYMHIYMHIRAHIYHIWHYIYIYIYIYMYTCIYKHIYIIYGMR